MHSGDAIIFVLVVVLITSPVQSFKIRHRTQSRLRIGRPYLFRCRAEADGPNRRRHIIIIIIHRATAVGILLLGLWI
jgi:hypothetical protein